MVFKILCYLLFRFGNVKPALTIENKRMRTSSALRSSCCRGPHARNLTGLRGTSSYTRDIACVAYLSPLFSGLAPRCAWMGIKFADLCTRLLSRSKHPRGAKTRWKESELSSTSGKRKFLQQNSNKLRYIVSGRSVSSRRLEFERNCNPSEMKSMFLAKNRWNFICRFSCILYRR